MWGKVEVALDRGEHTGGHTPPGHVGLDSKHVLDGVAIRLARRRLEHVPKRGRGQVREREREREKEAERERGRNIRAILGVPQNNGVLAWVLIGGGEEEDGE